MPGEHTYVGPRGGLVEPVSESVVLRRTIARLQQFRAAMIPPGLTPHQSLEIRGIIADVEGLALQAEAGYHRNPGPLNSRGAYRHSPEGSVVLSAILGESVDEIRYVHVTDGKAYRHRFEPDATLWAGRYNGVPCLAIIRADGKPIWKDFT